MQPNTGIFILTTCRSGSRAVIAGVADRFDDVSGARFRAGDQQTARGLRIGEQMTPPLRQSGRHATPTLRRSSPSCDARRRSRSPPVPARRLSSRAPRPHAVETDSFEPRAISSAWPSTPKPVTSVMACTSLSLPSSAPILLRVVVVAIISW